MSPLKVLLKYRSISIRRGRGLAGGGRVQALVLICIPVFPTQSSLSSDLRQAHHWGDTAMGSLPQLIIPTFASSFKCVFEAPLPR